MKSSQLKIDGYVFKKIHLEAFDAAEPTSWQVESNIDVLHGKENPQEWLVELTVKLKGDKPTSPYVGEFKVAGKFQVAADVSEESAKNLVNVNGPSVLYSAVRELVLQLTARGPHRNVLLPSVTFIDRKESGKRTATIEQPKKERKGNTEPVNAI